MNTPNTPFAEKASSLTDKELNKILNDPDEYSYLLVKACQEELLNRGLTLEKVNKLPTEKYFQYLNMVRQKISSGESIDDCKEYLTYNGLDSTQIKRILDKATEPPSAIEPSPYSNKEFYGREVWVVLVSLFILFKLIKYFVRFT